MKNIKYEQYLPVIVLILLLVLSFIILRPFLMSLFLGALLAYALHPLYRRLLLKIKNRSLVALLLCLIIVLLIAIPGAFFIKLLIQESYGLFILVKQRLAVGIFTDCDNSFCDALWELASSPVVSENVQAILVGIANWIVRRGSVFIASVPLMVLNLFVVFFTMYYFLKDGEGFVERLGGFLRLHHAQYKELRKRFGEIINGVVYGYLLVALMQGALGALGFFLFGVPSPLFWGVVMAFLALIPMLGAGLVWAPAALILLLDGTFQNSTPLIAKGIGLAVYGFFIISGLDNIIRPKLIGHKAGIHPAVILLGILGGVFVLGPLGVIIGPLLLSLTVVVAEVYKT